MNSPRGSKQQIVQCRIHLAESRGSDCHYLDILDVGKVDMWMYFYWLLRMSGFESMKKDCAVRSAFELRTVFVIRNGGRTS